MPANGRKRIVIIGGGFAGIYTARELERLLRGRDDYEITLVNRENYFVFQPMLPEVISGNIGILDTVSPIRRLLPRTSLHVRTVESIDPVGRTVTTSPGVHPHPHTIEFDYLVLALGCVTDFRGLRGLTEHALPFKNLADALHLRNHVIGVLEEAAIEEDAEIRRQLLTFVVAGGGFSGVEVVAELNDFVREAAASYPSIDPAELRVVLIHSQERILPEVSEKLGGFAARLLRRRGVELELGARLKAATREHAVLAGGSRIATRTLVSTVPASPHPLIDALAVPKAPNGRLAVDRFLRLEGSECIFALGDCAMVPEPSGNGFSPPTAQHAVRQARTAARNLVASIRGGALAPFAFGGLGKMGSLGRRSAVAEVFGVGISGFLAWWLWRTVYLMKLPGWGRRLKVATSWTLDLFLPPELVELRLSGSSGILSEHFEPGEMVFHQGDLGDRLYIIISGAAEVVRAGRVLARLGPGHCFGEMALLQGTVRNAGVRCVEPMQVLNLPKREYRLLDAYLPALHASFERVASARRQAEAAPAEG
jgi:NADH dehydrogenase